MSRIAFFLTVFAAVIAALVGPVRAQTPPQSAQIMMCAKHAQVVGHLAARYSEIPMARGLTQTGYVLEVLVSENGSWTIILTRPNGLSCLVSAGEDWEDLKHIIKGPLS